MKILENSTRGLLPHQKQLLYKTYVLSIVSYHLSLWFFNKASFLYHLKKLRKIQYKATLWITDTFHTFPTWGVEIIAGLIPIYLYLQTLSGRHQIRTSTLLLNHVINILFESRHANKSSLYCLSLENMITKQWLKIKSPIVDVNNHLNKNFPSFNSLNSEFSPGFKLIDNFSSHFSFHWANCKDKESKATHLCNLNDIFSNILLDSKSVIIVSDASIRNSIAISISHIYSHLNNIKKIIYHTVNVTSTEAELFAIRCEINQAIQISEAIHIIIIIEIIHTAQYIFNSIVHPYQL